jgi:hypothetical protein
LPDGAIDSVQRLAPVPKDQLAQVEVALFWPGTRLA